MAATAPNGTILCVWCETVNPKPTGTQHTKCVRCGLDPMPGEDPTKGGKVDPSVANRTKRSKRSAPKRGRLNAKPVGEPIVGIDPGARYTGLVVRDGDAVLHSSTLVRPQDMSSTDWAITCLTGIQTILKDFPRTIPIAIEGISDPKGFYRGQRAAINPRDIIRAGVVLGALVATYPTAVIVPPGNNGSQHYSHYPDSLIGRRPADLPGDTNGAGTRDHEQSAYDVAGKGARIHYRKQPPELFTKRAKRTT